ncbi:uncharacterized protein V6R79_004347 [Siganus canaliculatus]
MRAEPEPGPSRSQTSRQGYCGYCRVLYSSLDQHLSSLQHLDSVRTSSSRGSTSSTCSGRNKLTLLERFLQDVLQHHPHRYTDPRPSHADLPSVSTPLSPREELDELRLSDDGGSLGTRENLPSSGHASCRPSSPQGDALSPSHTADTPTQRESAPIRDQRQAAHVETTPPRAQTTPPCAQAPPPLHRKAHRKTNRRKTSESLSPTPPPRSPDPQDPQDPPPERGPWRSWQKERRRALWSEDDGVDETIEEVVQRCCHGAASRRQDDTDSVRFSLHVSMETQSDDWDSPVQVPQGPAPHTPVQVEDLSRLMDIHVDLEDQVYSNQLDSALHSERRARGGVRWDEGFWTLPIEEVLPAPPHIPESFRGKSWAQIEQEDEEKVEKLVRQFRRGHFTCYFDSESLARFGRRSQKKRRCSSSREAEPGVLPLLDGDEDASVSRRRARRRGFRLASRCQVVKVSHSTQTLRLVVPAVRQPAPEAPPTSLPTANQDAERTPDVQTWRCLPSSYSGIVSPLQPSTSLVYLLCSPSDPAPFGPPVDSASRRSRRRRRPLDLQGLKVKYKQLPVKFYNPSTNRILKNPPRGSAPSNPPPPFVRQLFRSLSPDLNTDRLPGEGPAAASRVKGLRPSSAETAPPDKTRRRGRTSQAPPPSPQRVRRERTQAPPTKRRTRAQTTPPQPRREGLRGAGPARTDPTTLPRRGRSRGRGLGAGPQGEFSQR